MGLIKEWLNDLFAMECTANDIDDWETNPELTMSCRKSEAEFEISSIKWEKFYEWADHNIVGGIGKGIGGIFDFVGDSLYNLFHPKTWKDTVSEFLGGILYTINPTHWDDIVKGISESFQETAEEHGWWYAAGALIPGIGADLLTDGALTPELLEGKVLSKADEIADAGKTAEKVNDLAKTIRRVDKVEDTVEILEDGSRVVTAPDGTKYRYGRTPNNSRYAGEEHPDTGVKYDKNGFPKFDSKVTYELPKEDYYLDNSDQFKKLNEQLYKDIENGTVANPFPDGVDYSSLESGKMPRKKINDSESEPYYTWHHNQEPGIMELVDKNTHGSSRHTGGDAIWGDPNNIYKV